MRDGCKRGGVVGAGRRGRSGAAWPEQGGVAGAGQESGLTKTELLMRTQRRLRTLRGRSQMRDGCDSGGVAGAGQRGRSGAGMEAGQGCGLMKTAFSC